VKVGEIHIFVITYVTNIVSLKFIFVVNFK